MPEEGQQGIIPNRKTHIFLSPEIPQHALPYDRKRNVNRGKPALVDDLQCRRLGFLVPLHPIDLFTVGVPELDQSIYTRTRVNSLSWPLIHSHQIEKVA
jgi:hypothetical protein